ncbi:lysophospholipid acyltransferase family protein [Qipengyuania vesicularis]|uniref:lysophospholipid acyltransferase family protein n=1 Tax=Qipengyuania vesicularis TaxID=2867232 RepID=UPI001C86EF4E|nr:lysophospholipid acyltransferase family protein [Qipengyuania vesicularis]MBX7528075.1 1-acyl-sn-glycerol-3-phosphate acyltransferase [Qipengyuania vesicularis]
MLLLRNLLFYPLFYLGSFLITAASLASAPFSLAAFRRRVRDWGRWQRWCLKHFIGADLVIEGKPQEEPVLYAIKHESFFEAIDAPALLGAPSVFAKKELFAIPGWGHAALAYGLIPVARDQGARMLMAMIRSAKRMVADGRPLVIFPEGTRVPHGERRPLQAGFAGLYKMLGLPVVPVAVRSGPVYHHWLKRPGTITYRFGEPIPPGLPRAEVEQRVVDEINALNS